MIRVEFHRQDDALIGFTMSGHAGAGVEGEDIVCAAVPSAAYMTANTVTEILNVPADITVDEGLMDLTVTDRVDACQSILGGFRLHLQALEEQYPTRVHLMNTEV
jgi:uncharacterized protein YsxB (DUF464 family)